MVTSNVMHANKYSRSRIVLSPNNITPKQRKVLSFIEMYVDSHNDAPTLFELKDFLGVKNMVSVYQYLAALEKTGALERDNKNGVGYKLKSIDNKQESIIRIPMVGSIVAGYPLLVCDDIHDYLNIDSSDLVFGKDYYALEVRGDSMQDSYILDSDVIVVEKTQHVQNGDMIVALIDSDQATLKHFYREESGVIRLQPANISYRPIMVAESRVAVQGKVVKVIRKTI